MRAAVEVAERLALGIKSGDKREGEKTEPWQKLKFDRQIIAVSLVEGATELFTTDALPAGVHRLSQFGGIHTGADNWNAAWRAFRAGKENATKEEMFDFAKSLVKNFRLGLFTGASSVENMFVIFVDPCRLNPYQRICLGRSRSVGVFL